MVKEPFQLRGGSCAIIEVSAKLADVWRDEWKHRSMD